MKKAIIFFIALLLFVGCNDSNKTNKSAEHSSINSSRLQLKYEDISNNFIRSIVISEFKYNVNCYELDNGDVCYSYTINCFPEMDYNSYNIILMQLYTDKNTDIIKSILITCERNTLLKANGKRDIVPNINFSLISNLVFLSFIDDFNSELYDDKYLLLSDNVDISCNFDEQLYKVSHNADKDFSRLYISFE